MKKEILIKIREQCAIFLKKENFLKILLGLFTLTSFVFSFCATSSGLAVLMGTCGLLGAAFIFPLEYFLGLAVLSVTFLSFKPHHPIAAICYGSYVLLPSIMINFYKGYVTTNNTKKTISIFYLINTLMNIITFVLFLFWGSGFQEYPLFRSWYGMLLPGFLSWQVGTFFSILLVCWAPKVNYPLASTFQVTTFDYWWIVLCQMGALFFQGEDQLLFYNMLLCGLLPFAIDGLLRIEKYIRQCSVWVSSMIGFLSIVSALPILFMVLCTLFQPWKKDSHGHC